jgi:hypothetical protein
VTARDRLWNYCAIARHFSLAQLRTWIPQPMVLASMTNDIARRYALCARRPC